MSGPTDERHERTVVGDPVVEWEETTGAARVRWPEPVGGARYTVVCHTPGLMSFADDRLISIDLFEVPERLRGLGLTLGGVLGRHYFDSCWLWIPFDLAAATRQLSGSADVELTLADHVLADHVLADHVPVDHVLVDLRLLFVPRTTADRR